MAKPTEVMVGETAFMVQPLDAFVALEIFGDLQKELLPAVGDLLSASIVGGENAAPNNESVAKALEALSKNLDGKQLKAWCDRLLTKDAISVELNGTMVPLDNTVRALVFREFTDILELLFHVLRINFAGPLMGFLSRFGLDQALTKTES